MYFVNVQGLADYNQYNKALKNVDYLGSPSGVFSNGILRRIARIMMSDTVLNIMPKKMYIPLIKPYSQYIEISQNNDGVCFLFNAHYYWVKQVGVLRYIKENVPNAKTCLYFSDKLSMYYARYPSFPSMKELQSSFDFIFTYNVIDAKEYDICLSPPVFPDYPRLNANQDLVTDLFFVGKDKGRLPFLIDIYDKCTSEGINCTFFITDVKKDSLVYREGITYNKRLPYSEVLERDRNSKCILNVVQDGAQGITMREYEALFYNCYLLTDNYFAVNSPLFREEQFIELRDDYASILKKKLDESLTPYSCAESYSQEKFYDWIEKHI